jgi:hypothetical protein
MGPMGAFGAGPGVRNLGHGRQGSHGAKAAVAATQTQAPHKSARPNGDLPPVATAPGGASRVKVKGFEQPAKGHKVVPSASAGSVGTANLASLGSLGSLGASSYTASVPDTEIRTLMSSQSSSGGGTVSRMSLASTDSAGTIVAPVKAEVPPARRKEEEGKVQEGGPNKPKIKGQIQSLAKMLSGLKTKH